MNRLQLRAEHSAQQFYNRRQIPTEEALAGDGVGNLNVSGRLGWLYVRMRGDSTKVTVAYNASSHAFAENDAVSLQWVKRTGIGFYAIVGYSGAAVYDVFGAGSGDGTGSAVAYHAWQHERMDAGTGGPDPLDIFARMVVPLRARPQTVPDDTLYVETGFNPLTGNLFAGGNSASFFPVPAVAGQARIDLLYLGSDDALHIVAGTPVGGGVTPTLPAVVVPSVPLAFVYLANAQTTIVEGNVYLDPGILRAPVGSVGGAPASAEFVTLALSGSLSQERVLTAGNGITMADGGANGNVTLSQTAASAGLDLDSGPYAAHHTLGSGGDQSSPGDHVHPAGNAALTLSTNGGWCWFSDPRAVYYNNQTYFGYIDNAGNVLIRSFNHISQTLSAEVTLHATLETDDHDNPSILIRNSDKRVIVFYSKHDGADKVIYERISTNPEDISAFAAETTIDPASGAAHYSYSNPIQLTGETNSPIYLFYRKHDLANTHAYVAYTKSTDGGVTWGAQVLVADVTYAKVAQNGVDRIDFAVSNHPGDPVDHGIYHFYYKAGSYYKSDGTLIAAALPLALTDITKVYDGSVTIGWIWDIAIDVEGQPAIVYATFPGGVVDHRYNYAKWVNGAWSDNQIVAEGDGTIYASPGAQDYYSGGVVLDHQDPTITYLSKYVSSKFEIWKYQTPDNGATWTGTAITSGSSDKNIRPVAVRNHASDLKLLWLEGTYATYISYTLNVMGYGSGVTSSVTSLAKSGDTALTGAVTLTGTGGIVLTEAGQNIAIDGSGITGGGGADHLHGLARWAADGSASAYELPDLAEYLEWASDNGVLQDQLTVSLDATRTQLVFASAPTVAHILQAEYVLERI